MKLYHLTEQGIFKISNGRRKPDKRVSKFYARYDISNTSIYSGIRKNIFGLEVLDVLRLEFKLEENLDYIKSKCKCKKEWSGYTSYKESVM
jgi:hypothetical protein